MIGLVQPRVAFIANDTTSERPTNILCGGTNAARVDPDRTGFDGVRFRRGTLWAVPAGNGSTATDIPVRSSGFSLWTGTALVLIGVMVNAASTLQYLRNIRDLNEGLDVTGRPSTLGVVLASLLCVAGVAMAGYLVIMR